MLWDVLRAFEKIIFNKEEFSKNLNSIVELARKSNIPIFFTSVQTLPRRFESPANIYTVSKLGFDRLFDQFTTEDMDFAIKLKHDEIVINKHTASIFIDTGFERMLRNAGITTVVFTESGPRRAREDAWEWIYARVRGAFSFEFCCSLLGRDPEDVRMRLQRSHFIPKPVQSRPRRMRRRLPTTCPPDPGEGRSERSASPRTLLATPVLLQLSNSFRSSSAVIVSGSWPSDRLMVRANILRAEKTSPGSNH